MVWSLVWSFYGGTIVSKAIITGFVANRSRHSGFDCAWKFDAHAQARLSIVTVGDAQAGLMQLTNPLHNRQTNAKAFVLLLSPIKSFGDARQLLRRNPSACIGNLHARLWRCAHINAHAAMLGGVADGVVDDVFEQDVEHFGRALNHAVVLAMQLDFNGFGVDIE